MSLFETEVEKMSRTYTFGPVSHLKVSREIIEEGASITMPHIEFQERPATTIFVSLEQLFLEQYDKHPRLLVFQHLQWPLLT